MNTLATTLKRLPNPALPRDLTADVLARIEGLEQPQPALASTAAPQSMWAFAAASVFAAAAIAVSVAYGNLPLFHVAPLSGLGMPSSGVGGLSLLVGLALYALGLFVTVGERRVPYSSTSP
jgi:hypothetical protein